MAITGSPGSATAIEVAISGEVQWSAGNLQSMITALESHEAIAAGAFAAFEPSEGKGRIQSTAESMFTNFGGRPPFNPGALVFTPAMIGPELAETAESLLSKFTATNDAAVGDAINFWTTYAGRMTDLSTDLVTAAQRLLGENSGAAIDAAVKYLVGLSGRVAQVSASAGIIAGHLGVLPAVRGMAISQLGAIEAEASVITDPAAREAFERSAISAFLTGPYVSQLQSSVPTIPNLTQPDFSVSAAKAAQSGLNGGQGLTGASQAGLAPAGMAASGATTAASAIPAATSGPISGPNGMNPAAPASPTAPMSPTAGATPTIPGGAPMSPAGASAPMGSPSAAMPMGPTAMNSATSPAGGHGASAAAPRGVGSMGGPVSGRGVPTSSGTRSPAFAGGLGRGAAGSSGVGGAGRGSGASSVPGGRSGTSATAVARASGAQAAGGRGAAGAAGSTGAGAAAQSPYRRGNAAPDADVGGIRGTANDYEQDEYQRELFGEEPVTVPALIGRNVRG